ncbi:MAG: diguanylate cyclase [Gammaproteobacteria bacterium]|nr:diguanylate cyclase [Gammaproteobacteria bacterium]
MSGPTDMPDFPVSAYMTTDVVTVSPRAPLVEVAARMRSGRISCVVVCEGTRPVGVISERDMVRLCGELLSGFERRVARDVMSPGIFTMSADATCSSALQMLRERQVRRMVIVDDEGLLAGVITQTDLLRAHTRVVEMQKCDLEQQVRDRTRKLAEANAELQALSRIDPLLKIGNRRAMDDELDKLQQRLERYGHHYSLALVDVDQFKRYNDHYGHLAGDRTLQRLAEIMRSNIRKPDDIFRYGGEEFLIVFPENDLAEAEVAAERVRFAIQAEAIPHQCSELGVVTASLGVGCEDLVKPNWSRLISRVDEALYQAKQNGRNRVHSVATGAALAPPTVGLHVV